MEPNRAGNGDTPSSGQPQPYVPSPFFGPGGQPPPGYRPPPGYQPPPGYGPPVGSAGFAGDTRTVGPGRGRPLLAVLFAFLIELIVIGGYSNQLVYKHLEGHFGGSSTGDLLVRSSLTYTWRFSPVGGSDFGHIWLAQLLGVVAFVVVSLALIALVVRGPVTYFRTFVSVWAVVVLATVLAAYVHAAIVNPRDAGVPGNRASAVLFYDSVNSLNVLAGVVLGLVAALVVATVAVATRRPVTVPIAVAPDAERASEPEPDQPPPFHGDGTPGGPPYGEQTYGDPVRAGGASRLDPSDERPGGYGTPQPAASGPYLFEQDGAPARHATPEADSTRRFPVVDAPLADDHFDEPDTAERTTRLPAYGATSEAAPDGPAAAPSAPSSVEQINEGGPSAADAPDAPTAGSPEPAAGSAEPPQDVPLPEPTRPSPAGSAEPPPPAEPPQTEPVDPTVPPVPPEPATDSDATTQFQRPTLSGQETTRFAEPPSSGATRLTDPPN